MIIFGNKGVFPGLMASIEAAGHWAYNRDGAWITSNDEAVQALIDAYQVSDALAGIVPTVKDLARTKILAFCPDWKQSNLNARQNELNKIRFDREWTIEEQAEVAAMEALWVRARAIREASNVHEAALRAIADVDELIAYDITAGWPE